MLKSVGYVEQEPEKITIDKLSYGYNFVVPMTIHFVDQLI